MKFLNYDIKSINKKTNSLKNSKNFIYFYTDFNDIFDDSFYHEFLVDGDVVDYFENQKILEFEYFPEVISEEDFDITNNSHIENSLHFYHYNNVQFLHKLNVSFEKIKLEFNKKKELSKSGELSEEEKSKKMQSDFIFDYFFIFLKYNYDKRIVKKRKNYMSIRPGISKNPKKDSLIRNKNIAILNQIINTFVKIGNKKTIFKHHNIMYENFYEYFKDDNNNDFDSKNFNIFKNTFENNPIFYKNLNFVLSKHLSNFDSLFEIKSKKNKRVKNVKDYQKYTYEIVYLKEDKRIRNTIKVLEVYSETFKSYFLWERLLFMYINLIINWQNSFLIKRRYYIYTKSIKLLKRDVKRKNYS